jgi:hypothetical protein
VGHEKQKKNCVTFENIAEILGIFKKFLRFFRHKKTRYKSLKIKQLNNLHELNLTDLH